MKIRNIFICILGIPGALWAQNDQDAIRYSLWKPKGTARSQSLSGAINAMGADFSNASGNVAGLGVFRKGQVAATVDLTVSPSNAGFYGDFSKQTKTTFGLGNAGFLYSHRSKDEKKTKGLLFSNFYAGFNKINDFNKRLKFSGVNPTSSYLEPMLDNFNNGIGSDFYENLALNSELFIQPSAGSPYMAFNSPWPGFNKLQERASLGKGSLSEINFAFSGNVSNKLYFGLGFNVNTLSYKETSIFTESEINDDIADFRSFTFTENFQTKGTGYNGKFGLIYRPIDLLRIGVSFHTPTWFTMTDRFQNSMSATYDNGNTVKAESPNGNYRYKMQTPLKVSGQLGLVFGRKAFIDMEYDYVPNTMLVFREFDGSKMIGLNDAIRGYMQANHTIRLGGEYKIGVLGLRAGAFYGTSITQAQHNNPISIFGVSAGLGVRLPNGFFLDAAYQFMKNSNKFWAYSSALVEPANISQTWHTPSITMGVAF